MVVKLIERGVPRQSTHALDAAQLVQNPPYCEIHVKLVECPYLGQRESPLSNISREIPQPRVAQNVAKFSCCGQYPIFGPLSHVFASAGPVCVGLAC